MSTTIILTPKELALVAELQREELLDNYNCHHFWPAEQLGILDSRPEFHWDELYCSAGHEVRLIERIARQLLPEELPYFSDFLPWTTFVNWLVDNRPELYARADYIVQLGLKTHYREQARLQKDFLAQARKAYAEYQASKRNARLVNMGL